LFLFLFGFLLGDGSIFIRVRQTAQGALNFIPILFFPQKTTEYNTHMFSMFAAFFNMGINPIIRNEKPGITFLQVEGVKAISLLIPMLYNNRSYGYWKSENIDLLTRFFECYSAGLHTYREGVIRLIKILYKYPNKRDKSFEDWEKLANEYFDNLESGISSGYQFIRSKKGKGDLANEQIAWKVILPEKFKLESTPSSKYFHFSTYDYREKALQAAISYHNLILEKHLE
jgi:hypothetical protein